MYCFSEDMTKSIHILRICMYIIVYILSTSITQYTDNITAHVSMVKLLQQDQQQAKPIIVIGQRNPLMFEQNKYYYTT